VYSSSPISTEHFCDLLFDLLILELSERERLGCVLIYVCGSLLGADAPQPIRRRCVSQRDRKIYGLDADMPQRIRRFVRPSATKTAVFDSAVVCQRRAGPGRAEIRPAHTA
jgi:hypothetical protein